MSYRQVVDGLHVRFATLSGIAYIQFGEPEAVQSTPMIYTLLDGFTRTTRGQVTEMQYTSLHRLVIDLTNREAAEDTIATYINALPAAIDADPQLGGVLTQGRAAVVSADSGWVSIADAFYRVVDFRSNVIEKGTYGEAGL